MFFSLIISSGDTNTFLRFQIEGAIQSNSFTVNDSLEKEVGANGLSVFELGREEGLLFVRYQRIGQEELLSKSVSFLMQCSETKYRERTTIDHENRARPVAITPTPDIADCAIRVHTHTGQ